MFWKHHHSSKPANAKAPGGPVDEGERSVVEAETDSQVNMLEPDRSKGG